MARKGWTRTRQDIADRKVMQRPPFSREIRGLCTCRQRGCIMCNRLIGKKRSVVIK